MRHLSCWQLEMFLLPKHSNTFTLMSVKNKLLLFFMKAVTVSIFIKAIS